MKKHILLLLLILTSCASRQVHVEKTELKKDSVVETKVIITTIENDKKTDSTNINITTDNSEIVITPIDSSKTIVVEGKSYKNVVLRIKKSKVNTSYRNNKTESNIKRKDSIVDIKAKETNETSILDKKTKKQPSCNWYIWLLILILILYLLWRNKPSLLKLLRKI